MKKKPLPNRPGMSANDGARKSGHGPTYIKGENGRITKTVYRCACHGREFETRPMLQMHIRQYHTAVRRDFAELVRTGGLGQEAWLRLPGETPLQYKRFQCYLNSVDPKTALRSVHRTAKTMGVEPRIVERGASNWHWRLRAQIWDSHIEAEEFRAFETSKRQSARRQANLGKRLQEVAMAGASKLLANEDRLDEMSGNEIAKLADVGSKVERLANSDPTAISEDRGQVKLVWEGPRPSWAPATEDQNHQLPAPGPLTTRVLEGER